MRWVIPNILVFRQREKIDPARVLVCLTSIFCFSVSLNAQEFSPIVLTDSFAEERLAFSWACHDSYQGQQERPPISEFQLARKSVNLGYVPDTTCWVGFRLMNQGSHARVYLEHPYPLTSSLTLFRHDKEIQRIGASLPFSQRLVPFAFPVFKLPLDPGRNDFFIRMRSNDLLQLDFKIWEPIAFHAYTPSFYIIQGGFFALCLGMGLYNLMQFLVTRRISFAYYVGYLVGFSVGQLFLTGILHQFALFDVPSMTKHLGFGALQFAVVSSLCFAHSFLRLPKLLPRGQFLLVLPLIPFVIAMLNNILGNFSLTGWWNIWTFAISGPLVVSFGLLMAFRRQRSGYFFTAGWGFLAAGILVFLGSLVGLLPDNLWTRHAHLLGASLEIILFSFGLADQIKQIQLKATREKEHAFSQLKKMVYPHQLTQMKAGANLEDTMPCDGSEAIVICFDIVGSSKMDHPRTKDFFSRVFDRCHDLMECEYHFRPLTAHGFRLKEMGDGFLCSVNFPFQSPSHRQPESLAVDLAYGFLRIFDEVVEDLEMPRPCQASIGIAKGYVEGFFTLSGTRHYELFGHGITLATRYETLRKSIPLLDQSSHLMTIQEKVIRELDENYQQPFRYYDLRAAQTEVRDDADATGFYYLVLPVRGEGTFDDVA